MLEPLDKIIPLLVCPKSGSKLIPANSELLEAVDSAAVYNYTGSHPVLIDFEASVLDREATMSSSAASLVGRADRQMLGRFAKWLVSPSNKKTTTNVSSFIEELKSKHQRPRVLIIGGGTAGVGMDPFYSDPDIRLVSFDIYVSPIVQFVADGHQIPLADRSFDGVVAQAVIEHVLEPQQVVSEIYRVLRDDGLVYAETPFMQQVHEGAYDFTRFTDSGHRYLFRRFDNIVSGALHGAADHLLRSIDYFFRSLFRSEKAGKAAKLLFFWIKYFDRIIPEPYAIDAASAVFFMGRKSESAITARQAVDHYQGGN